MRDLQRLQDGNLTAAREFRPTRDGHYFTPDPSYSFIARPGQGLVMPVYLRIEHPVYLNASAIEGAGLACNIARYKKDGFDGAIFARNQKDLCMRDWLGGSSQFVAFDACQIKSAIGNRGTFDIGSNDILE